MMNVTVSHNLHCVFVSFLVNFSFLFPSSTFYCTSFLFVSFLYFIVVFLDSLDIVILNIIYYHNYHVYRFCVFKRSAFLPFMLCDVYIFLVMLQLWFPDSYCQVKKFRLMMILGRTLKYIVNIKNQKEIKEGNITENQSKKIFQLRKNILTVMSQNQG